MSDLLEETAPGGGVEGEAAGVEGEAPGVVEPAAQEATPEPATSPWAPPQEQWESLVGTVQQLAQSLQPAPAVPEAPSFVQTDDTTGETLVDPAGLQRYIEWQVEQGIQSRVGQYEPVLQQTQAQQGEQIINQRFEALQDTVGTFDTALAREIAEGIASRGGIDPNSAIEQGARRAAEHDKTVAARAVEEYKKTLGAIGQAPREPGANGAAIPGFEPQRGADGKIPYGPTVDNWIARNGLS